MYKLDQVYTDNRKTSVLQENNDQELVHVANHSLVGLPLILNLRECFKNEKFAHAQKN